MDTLLDRLAVAELIGVERAACDQARWDVLGDCYHPDASLRLSWFQGSGAEFVARSKLMRLKGNLVCHQVNPPFVLVNGDRGIAEVGIVVHLRSQLNSVAVDVTVFARICYRAERRDGRWRVLSLDAIYHKDAIAPADPSDRVELDEELLARCPADYRFLAYLMETNGHPVASDLPGDSRPDLVAQLRIRLAEWLAGASG